MLQLLFSTAAETQRDDDRLGQEHRPAFFFFTHQQEQEAEDAKVLGLVTGQQETEGYFFALLLLLG